MFYIKHLICIHIYIIYIYMLYSVYYINYSTLHCNYSKNWSNLYYINLYFMISYDYYCIVLYQKHVITSTQKHNDIYHFSLNKHAGVLKVHGGWQSTEGWYSRGLTGALETDSPAHLITDSPAHKIQAHPHKIQTHLRTWQLEREKPTFRCIN